MTVRRPQVVESNPLKTAGWIVATIALIVGAAAGVDERYAHAGDIKALSAQLEVNRLTAEVSVLEIRRGTLQDKVYEAKSRNLRTKADIEIADRYARELADVEKQIDTKRREINQVKK